MNLRINLAQCGAALILGAGALFPLAGHTFAAAAPTEADGPNLVHNGGFERGADPSSKIDLPAGSPFLTDWTVVGSEVAYMGTWWKAEEGTRSLSLGNPSAAPGGALAGGVTQKVATTAGQRYRVVFYQAASPFGGMPSTIRCLIGSGTHDYTYQDSPPSNNYQKMSWIKRSFIFTATSARTAIGFYAWYTPGNTPLGLDNVQVRAILPPAGATTSAPGSQAPAASHASTSLQIGSASVAAGAQQTLRVTAAPNAALGLIIDYPDGTQAVLPERAGADGAYTYTWTIPATVHGSVHVMVDSAGVTAQATFTVA